VETGINRRRYHDTPLTDLARKVAKSGFEKECFSLINADRTLTCADCGQEFVFTASEQQFYADRGFSDPRRCRSCRAARKAQMGGGDSSGMGGGYGANGGYRERRPREMFEATCSNCGKTAMVPFRPRPGLLIYVALSSATPQSLLTRTLMTRPARGSPSLRPTRMYAGNCL
jgi:CxxC-x17-CxxC domain-containing protein